MSHNANVQVFLRMRPFGENEADKDKGYSFDVFNDVIAENSALTGGSLKFQFDHVFGIEDRNRDVYDRSARHVVDSCLQGYNGVIFAYGQTSSGKTHSVLGYDGDQGIIPMAMTHIFDHIKASRREWLLRCSYIEVYNENLHDLLRPQTPSHKLVIFEDELGHTQVKNIQEEIVRSEQDVMSYIAKGTQNRHVGKTAMNAQSSRSHAVFTMIIESKELEKHDSFRFANKTSLKEKGTAVTVSNLYMVDLAGSERSDKTQAQGKTLGEGTFINKSLLTLSRCITQLAKSSGKKGSFIAYRDSKLTRLIRVGLGGNSKLSVLCCITPGFSHYSESVSTMRFGQNARMIQNKSTVNQVKDESALLKQYKREIEELRQKLESGDAGGDNEQMKQELEQHKKERAELEQALKEITQLILVGDELPADPDEASMGSRRDSLLSVDEISESPSLSDYEGDSDVSQSPSLTIRTAVRHARAGSISLKDTIRHLKDTIAGDKTRIDEIQRSFNFERSVWSEEQKRISSERKQWEEDRAIMKTAEKTFRIKELEFLEKRNEWKKKEHEHEEKVKKLTEQWKAQQAELEVLLEEEKQINKQNSRLLQSALSELDELKKENRRLISSGYRENSEYNISLLERTNKNLELKVMHLKNEFDDCRVNTKQHHLKITELEERCLKLEHERTILGLRNADLQRREKQLHDDVHKLRQQRTEEGGINSQILDTLLQDIKQLQDKVVHFTDSWDKIRRKRRTMLTCATNSCANSEDIPESPRNKMLTNS